MDGLHRLLAYGAITGTLIGAGWAAILVITRRTGGPAFERLQAAVVAALIVGTIDEDKVQAQAFTRERKLQVAQRSCR